MAKWRHSGFNVHCGPRILPRQADAMENLARYIIRASFSQERLSYDAQSATVVYILEPQISDNAFRKNWARLIQKIYEVDPLVCPLCQGAMRVIAVIEDQEVIRKILTHLGLWQIKARPWPIAYGPPDLAAAPFNDWPAPSADDYLTDPPQSARR